MRIFDILITPKGFNNNVKWRSQVIRVPYLDVIHNEIEFKMSAELDAIMIMSGKSFWGGASYFNRAVKYTNV